MKRWEEGDDVCASEGIEFYERSGREGNLAVSSL